MSASADYGITKMDLFPFNSIRKGQTDFLDDARHCMKEGLCLLAMAPTGTGKTAVSLTAALEYSLQSGGKVVFLTSRQSQHMAALSTIARIGRKWELKCLDMISKEDMCLANRGEIPPCAAGHRCFFMERDPEDVLAKIFEKPLPVRKLMEICKREGVCPYMAARSGLNQADVVVCDYNLIFGDGTPTISSRIKQSDLVLIVDEAHNLPDRVMDAHSAALHIGQLEAAVKSIPEFRDDLEILFSVVNKIIEKTDEKILDAAVLDTVIKERCGVDCTGLWEEMESLLPADRMHSHRQLMKFLRLWNSFGKGALRFATRDTLEIRLIDPGIITAPVFHNVRRSLLMSATLHPPAMYAELLGIRRYICREYQSSFPPENRQILAVGGVTTLMRKRSQLMYRAISSKISIISKSIPGNIVAFFPSYRLMDHVKQYYLQTETNRDILIEKREYSRNEKESIIHMLSSRNNIILMAVVGGSFSEGVDFRDNIIQGVIIVGFPLNPPSLVSSYMERYLGQKYGQSNAHRMVTMYPAVSKVLQAAGRAIRSERDRAVIVLLDDRYLMQSLQAYFPSDFKIEASLDLEKEIGEFFR